MNYDEMPSFLKSYLFYLLTIKGRSKLTVDGYAIDLCGFLRFIKIHKKNGIIPQQLNKDITISDIDISLIRSITLLDVYEYLNYAMNYRKNSDRARSRKISAIKGMFKYITVNLKLLENNPVENLELPTLKKTLPKYLSVEQSKQLLDSVKTDDGVDKYRDYCIISLFLNCGMRLSELAKMNINDFNLQTGTLRLLGKGNKERVIFLNNASKKAIKKYLQNYRNTINPIIDEKALFISKITKKRIGARQIQNIVKKELDKAGLSNMGFSTHKLRHTAATLLYQYGDVDILVLKEILGHSNVGTTEIYTHVSDEIIKNEIEKNPLSDKKLIKKKRSKNKSDNKNNSNKK